MAVVTDTTTNDTEEAFDIHSIGYPSMLWGRWLREYGNVEEAKWRKCFRPRILEKLGMLDDNDPSNDTRALTELVPTLFQANHRDDAVAILAGLFTPLEALLQEHAEQEEDHVLVDRAMLDDKTTSTQANTLIEQQITSTIGPASTQLGTNPKSHLKLQIKKEAWAYSCHNCRHYVHQCEEFFFCEICYDKNFCGACLTRVKAGTLLRRQCNPEH